MAQYIPKSKINILEAGPGEFIRQSNNKPYVGPYLELSNGKYFAGKGINRINFEIIKPISIPNHFGKTKNIAKYNILNKKSFEALKEVENIVPTKTIPTEEDYKKGYYTRYFLVKVNQKNKYCEIDKDTFTSLNKKEKKYNWPLYKINSILWSLNGNTSQVNKNQIELQRITFPYLDLLFFNLNEFKSKETDSPQELESPSQPKNIIDGAPIEKISEIAPEYNSPTLSTNPPVTNIPSSGGGGGGY